MNTSMSSLFQYKIKTFYKQQTELQTANSGSIYFRSFPGLELLMEDLQSLGLRPVNPPPPTHTQGYRLVRMLVHCSKNSNKKLSNE